jgi:hypothetical protein
MARDDSAPFARGETYNNGGLIDTVNLGGINLEGKEFVFEPDSSTSLGSSYGALASDASGRGIRVRVVRNISAVNLKPSRLAHYQASDPIETKVDGYCYAIGDRVAGVIDEYLPAAGVPPNDLFYIVTDGPTLVKQAHSSPVAFAIGDVLVPIAGGAASVTDDLGGRVGKQDLTGATATLANNIINQVGYVGVVSTVIDDVFKAVVHRAHR